MLSPLYGQLSPLRVPTILPPDPDALAYIAAVETADGQALEDGVKSAYDQFFKGLKQDGIWSAIKSSCIVAGARTLSGALIPLVGTAPTNFNFVSSDYSRRDGLKGNGTTKYLNSNRNNAVDPQNNKHVAGFYTQIPTRTVDRFILGIATSSATTQLGSSPSGHFFRLNGQSSLVANPSLNTGLFAASRNNSANIQIRYNSSSGSVSRASEPPPSLFIDIYRRGTTGNYSDGRLSFYSIGEHLDLAALDTRVSNLMTALAAAIP
jgi:hypothetical protein